MNDIFLSYDRSDRQIAHLYSDALEARGWSVFWDREIPFGKPFDQVIEEQLNAARCVVVLWSKQSVQSRWVKTEASAAAERESLVPVLIEEVAIPFEFRRIQTAELWHWQGAPDDPVFQKLIEAVGDKLGQRATSEPARPPAFPNATPTKARWPTGKLLAAAALVILIAVVILGTRVFELIRQSASINSADPVSTDPVNLPAAAAATPSSGTATVPDDAFTIKIGDKIDDGVPVSGAGAIEKPYSLDNYVFSATPGQSVYFRMMRHSAGLSYIRWQLRDEDGTQVFNTCLGCTEAGVQHLSKGGRYVLSVGADNDPSTGTYQLQLFNVPPPSKSTIRIGGGPIMGAIESPGAADIYTLEANPRQRVYFRMLEHSPGMSYIKWQLADSNGMSVFNTCLGCTEAGVQTLISGGEYTLTVENKTDPSTGTYRIQLFDVPPSNPVAIRIGERITNGAIEGPGAEDVYTFTASPGQKVSFRLLSKSVKMDYIRWRLVDDNSMEVFNTCLACTEPGIQTLIRGGKYTLIVGNTGDPSTGTYAFETGSR